jgi:MFS family permease
MTARFGKTRPMSPTTPSVWRIRDFRLVMAAGTVNDIGDWMLSLALPIYVFTETGSGRDTALVFLIELAIDAAFGPHGGALADRWNLRRTLITTNVLQALALLPLLFVNHDRVWLVFVVAAMQALLGQVNNPASFAVVPRVVAEDQLVQANASFSAGGSIARLIGAPLGGIAIATGGLNTVVAVDAATFLAVAFALVFLQAPTDPIAKSAGEGTTDEQADELGVVAGWRSIRTRPVLVGYLVAQSLAQLAFAMFPLVFIKFVIVELDGGGTEIGVIRGCAAFGGLVASVLITRAAKRVNPAHLMMWGYFSFALVGWTFINATFVTKALPVYLVLFAFSGLPNATSQIGATATAQRWCPPEIRGRLSGVMSATGAIGAAIGTILAGALVDHVNVIALFNGQTTVFFLAGMASLFLIVRRLDDPIHEI